MVLKKSIFSIPIYFCSFDESTNRIKCEKEKFDVEQRKTYAFKKLGITQEFSKTYPSWKYNRIIGWIDIYINGKTLKADYWLINSQRITFNVSKKHFKYMGKIADISTRVSKNAILKPRSLTGFWIHDVKAVSLLPGGSAFSRKCSLPGLGNGGPWHSS